MPGVYHFPAIRLKVWGVTYLLDFVHFTFQLLVFLPIFNSIALDGYTGQIGLGLLLRWCSRARRSAARHGDKRRGAQRDDVESRGVPRERTAAIATFFFFPCRTMASESQANAAAPEQLANAVKNMSVKEKPAKKVKAENTSKDPLEVRILRFSDGSLSRVRRTSKRVSTCSNASRLSRMLRVQVCV